MARAVGPRLTRCPTLALTPGGRRPRGRASTHRVLPRVEAARPHAGSALRRVNPAMGRLRGPRAGTERESVDASTCARARGAWSSTQGLPRSPKFQKKGLAAKCNPLLWAQTAKARRNGCRQRRAAKTRATTSAFDSDAAARRRRLLRAARAASRTASGLLARARASRLRPLSQPNHVHLQAVGGLTIRERKLHAHHTHRGREANSWRRSRQRRLRAGATG